MQKRYIWWQRWDISSRIKEHMFDFGTRKKRNRRRLNPLDPNSKRLGLCRMFLDYPHPHPTPPRTPMFRGICWSSRLQFILKALWYPNSYLTRILIPFISYSMYCMSENRQSGLIVCNLPYGMMITTYSQPVKAQDAIKLVENACTLLRN